MMVAIIVIIIFQKMMQQGKHGRRFKRRRMPKIRCKVCENPKCRDSYNLGKGFTKWKEELTVCPTCKKPLKLKIITPATLNILRDK